MTKEKIVSIVFIIVLAIFVYWEYTKHYCNETLRQNMADSKMTISEASDYYDFGYNVCMGKRGF